MWTPPYDFVVPEGWTTEHFSLPPDFAAQITYKGVEDLRFTPGWGDTTSEEHWTYAFLWWLEGNPKIDESTLQQNLKLYYSGLVARNIPIRNIQANKIVSTVASIKKIKTDLNDLETYSGTISMLDYHTQKPIVLNLVIHVKDSKTTNRRAIYFEVSPKPFSHSIWQKLNAIGESFDMKN